MSKARILELSENEVQQAMTEWLNNHRFKEPVTATGLKLNAQVSINGRSQVFTHMVEFVYTREDLANE